METLSQSSIMNPRYVNVHAAVIRESDYTYSDARRHSNLKGVVGRRGGVDFETAASRGRVTHVRLRDGRAWTVLTSMVELKGHKEERRGPTRALGSTARTRLDGARRAADVAGGRRAWGQQLVLYIFALSSASRTSRHIYH